MGHFISSEINSTNLAFPIICWLLLYSVHSMAAKPGFVLDEHALSIPLCLSMRRTSQVTPSTVVHTLVQLLTTLDLGSHWK